MLRVNKRVIFPIIGVLMLLSSIFVPRIPSMYLSAQDEIKATSYTPASLSSEVRGDSKYSRLMGKDWNAKIEERCIDHIPDERLKELLEYFPEKINQLTRDYVEHPESYKSLEDRQALESDVARLKDKYALVEKEVELRKTLVVEREIHHTIYYIDFTNGNDSNDGLTPATAWLTPEQYTSKTVRTAGDIAYIRAGGTYTLTTGTHINFDEDGYLGSPISIIGCDSVINDPWGDASDTKPTIDLNFSSGEAIYLSGDNSWLFDNLRMINANNPYGILRIYNSLGIVVTNCHFEDYNNYGGYGGIGASGSSAIIENCSFKDMYSTGAYLRIGSGKYIIRGCTTEAGDNNNYAQYGIRSDGDSTILVEDSTFSDVYRVVYGGSSNRIFLRNCDVYPYGSYPGLYGLTESSAFVSIEDCFNEGSPVADGTYFYPYSWVKENSTIQLDSLNSIELYYEDAPNFAINCLTLRPMDPYDFALWCPDGSTTISLKAREVSAWSNSLTSSEFYIEASYYDHATNKTRSRVQSTQSLNGTSEVTLSVTFTQQQEGWVYLSVCQTKSSEEDKYIVVSIKPTVS